MSYRIITGANDDYILTLINSLDKIFNLLESQIINTKKNKSSSYNIYLKYVVRF